MPGYGFGIRAVPCCTVLCELPRVSTLTGFLRLLGSAACWERVSAYTVSSPETGRTEPVQGMRLSRRPRLSGLAADIGGRVCATARCVGFSCSTFRVSPCPSALLLRIMVRCVIAHTTGLPSAPLITALVQSLCMVRVGWHDLGGVCQAGSRGGLCLGASKEVS